MNSHKNIASNNNYLPNSLNIALTELEETATQIQAEVAEIADLLPQPLNEIPVRSLLQNLLYPLLDCIRQVFKVDTVAVLFCSQDKQHLVVHSACGLEEEVAAGIQIPIGCGFAGKIAAKREITIVDDLSQVDVFSPILRHKGLQSMLGMPLLINNQVVGVFHVGTFHSRRFSIDEVQLLKIVAARIGIVINSMLLLHASSKQKSEKILHQQSHKAINFQLYFAVAKEFFVDLIRLFNLECSIA
ncbi:GAF domain-containing protein [Gloeocapsopsis crepidinum LEGE 06123]|uniref:GAF domain-containing protein n=1 Tax=Gloeocapsopsis crepidinum LEGE 06123 TaxID=588587 RepID=A0ABR9UR20_9CHRO|nr:GAF domain-containing protein [Gloeocapsopsis crepidinum]MBE9190498.1 GAF domain-containing protein [Gloeocapsopsis crepidinum LEGE 06123]